MKSEWLNRYAAPPLPYFTLCLSEKEYKAVLKYLKVKDDSPWVNPNAQATTHLLENKDKNEAAIVCIKDWQNKEPYLVASLLVHEAVHIWQSYLRSINETAPGSEQEAYGIQLISQELFFEFNRRMQNG